MAVLSQPQVTASVQPAALAQLYQAYLLLSKSPDGTAGLHSIPPQLLLTAWQAFRATQEATVQAPLPDITQVRT